MERAAPRRGFDLEFLRALRGAGLPRLLCRPAIDFAAGGEAR